MANNFGRNRWRLAMKEHAANLHYLLFSGHGASGRWADRSKSTLQFNPTVRLDTTQVEDRRPGLSPVASPALAQLPRTGSVLPAPPPTPPPPGPGVRQAFVDPAQDLNPVLRPGSTTQFQENGKVYTYSPGIEAAVHPGSVGLDVRNLQKSLIQQGLYKGRLDGIYGPKTLAAVRQAQGLAAHHHDITTKPKYGLGRMRPV